jgi:N4-gp56 family major capsid protein
MAQEWTTGSLGGYLANAKLSKTVRYAAQPMLRFRQFATVTEEFGKSKGDTINFNKVSNLATSGGTLVETSTIPKTELTIVKGTLTLTEYGLGVNISGKVKDLSEINVDNMITKALKNDQVKVLDKAVYTEMATANICYVGSGTASGVITSNGTATASATSNMNAYHAKGIIDYMMATMKAPPVDGEYYFSILTVAAARGLHDDLEAIWKYTQYPANGEIGRYYKARFVRDTYSMNNAIGNSSITGEGFFFGDDAIMEAVAVPEEIRADPPTDGGRSWNLYWYAILGFKIIWAGDPDNRIVRWTSA